MKMILKLSESKARFLFCVLGISIPHAAFAASSGIDGLAVGALIFMILMAVVGVLYQNSKLEDPNDKSIVYLDQIIDVAELGEAEAYDISYTRQSGNQYKPTETWSFSKDDSEELTLITKDSLRDLVSTLRRARWEAAWVMENSRSCLRFMRKTPNARKNEGKKLGFVEVRAVGLASPEEQ